MIILPAESNWGEIAPDFRREIPVSAADRGAKGLGPVDLTVANR
jgi:hypothetical protein